MRQPLVSVIVPTKNSGSTLDMCLSSIANQTHANTEIVVVDSNSTDSTKRTARKYTEKVYNKSGERNPARNYGAKMSRGKYILIMDSDMELTPGVVRECVSNIRDKAAIMIPEISVGNGFWARCKGLEKKVSTNDDDLEAVRFFRKDIFLDAGGYDEKMVAGEDWDLSQRIIKSGMKISRIRSTILHHEGTPSILKLMKKKYYYGKSISSFIRKHPDIARKQFIPVRPAYIRNWRTMLSSPLLASGLVFMKFCEFSAGGWGLLVSKMRGDR